MTYYTTVTFNNKLVGSILRHPREFTEKLVKACAGELYKRGLNTFSIGVEETLALVQKPREFSEDTLFVFKNGVLQEMSAGSPITNDLLTQNAELYNELTSFIARTLDGLVVSNQTIDTEFFKLETTSQITSIEVDNDEVVAKWLKQNKIPITVTKLKKLKSQKLLKK